MKRAAAVILALLAVGLLALLITGTYGLSREYDLKPADASPVTVMIVLLLGCLALLFLLGARSLVGARRPATAVLAVTVLVVFAGSAAASAGLGGAAHDRRTTTEASACSVGDRELLAGVDFTGYREGPHGGADGGCVLNLFPHPETTTVVADLTAALERDGWRTAESGGEPLTLERGGAALMLSPVSDDKVTGLVLTLR